MRGGKAGLKMMRSTKCGALWKKILVVLAVLFRGYMTECGAEGKLEI